MKVISLEDTDLTLPQVAEMAKRGPVILTQKGKPMASVKRLSRSDWEGCALADNPQFQALVEKSRRSFEKEGGIRLQDLRKELRLTGEPHRRSRKKKRR